MIDNILQDLMILNGHIIFSTKKASASEISDAFNYLEESIYGKGLPFIHKISCVKFKTQGTLVKGTGSTIDSLLTNLEKVFLVSDNEYNEIKTYTLKPNKTYYANDIFGKENVLVNSYILTTQDEQVKLTIETIPSFDSKGTEYKNRNSIAKPGFYTTPTLLYFSLYPHVIIKERNLHTKELILSYDKNFNKYVFEEYLNYYLENFKNAYQSKTEDLLNDTFEVDTLIERIKIDNAIPAYKKIKNYYDSKFIPPLSSMSCNEQQSYYYYTAKTILVPPSYLRQIETEARFKGEELSISEVHTRAISRLLIELGVSELRIDNYVERIKQVLCIE